MAATLAGGHEDDAAHSQGPEPPGDGGAVVPRRGGDDAALHLLRPQRQELVHRAAQLERARALQVLELEVNRGAARAAEDVGRLRRRLQDVRPDARLGRLDRRSPPVHGA
jgi:hypothetical protein